MMARSLWPLGRLSARKACFHTESLSSVIVTTDLSPTERSSGRAIIELTAEAGALASNNNRHQISMREDPWLCYGDR